jgi:hypothetical protein
MAQVAPHQEKYLKAFEAQFAEIDESALIVLKCHLILEGVLDNIIATIFFHPEHLREARLSFSQKVRIARSYCLHKDTLPIWTQISALNALRNEVAHKLEDEKRARKMDALRQAYLADCNPEWREEHSKASDPEIIIYACGDAVGFLSEFEYDLGGLRRMLDAFRLGQ